MHLLWTCAYNISVSGVRRFLSQELIISCFFWCLPTYYRFSSTCSSLLFTEAPKYPKQSSFPSVLESSETETSLLRYPENMRYSIYIPLVSFPPKGNPWIGLLIPFSSSCALLGKQIWLRWMAFLTHLNVALLGFELAWNTALNWFLEFSYSFLRLFISVKFVSLWGYAVWSFYFTFLLTSLYGLLFKYLLFCSIWYFYSISHGLLSSTLLVDSISFNTY